MEPPMAARPHSQTTRLTAAIALLRARTPMPRVCVTQAPARWAVATRTTAIAAAALQMVAKRCSIRRVIAFHAALLVPTPTAPRPAVPGDARPRATPDT